jgi:hypothetical protein
MPVPLPLAASFRVATAIDIRSWSFGALTLARAVNGDRTHNCKGTLHDQRIFGPVRDFHCACGKYEGIQFENMVCDMCGVKIASKNLRNQRFGHVDFTEPLVHPFDTSCRLTCFPVLPANYFESPAGSALQELYDRLIMSIQTGNPRLREEVVCSIIGVLTPIAQMAYNWSLPSVNTISRGLALETN